MPHRDDGRTARINELAHTVIGAALDVHKEIGPGMLESAYEACLAFELLARGLAIERQKPFPLVYRGQRVDCGYRIDLVVEGLLVVEVKSLERVQAVHRAQVLSYLRMSKMRLGLLLNFNVQWLRDGIERIVNGLPE